MKATSRIKFGAKRKAGEEPREDKSHLTTLQPGDTVPKGADLDDDTKLTATDEGEKFEPTIDPDDSSTFEGLEAALESKRCAPDNPNRPSSIEGEDSWKVNQGGAFGRETRNLMEDRGAKGKAKGRANKGGDDGDETGAGATT